MILFSIGFPSHFASWCDAVLARLVSVSVGESETIAVNTLDDIARGVLRAKAPHLIAVGRSVDGPLRQALTEVNARSIVALSHPRNVLREIVLEQALSVGEATRVVARSCASILSWMKDRNALVLYADNAARDPVAAAAAIANHFQLPVNPSDVAAIATECAGGGFEGSAEDAWFMSLSDSERAVVEGALDGYAGAFAGGEIGDIIWHRDLFFLYEQPYSHPPPAATRAVDIAGTPRNIIFGPYLSLPPGSWSASVSLVFSREAAELNYTIQISAGTAPLSSLTIKPLPEIVMNANLHFTITEQIDQLLEIYIQSDRAAIDGLVAMLGVVLSPTAPQSANAQAYLTSAPVP